MAALQLKDIHLPTPVGYWPPAPGWWLLALLLPVLAWAGYRFYRRPRRRAAVKTAQAMLAAIRDDAGMDDRQKLAALSALLRRAAISRDGRESVAGLHGDAWLRYLDAELADRPFSEGEGRCLADGPYRPLAPTADISAVTALCERWLKQRAKSR